MGKTRLVEEFVRGIGDAARFLRGRCLSYGEGITFWALAESLGREAGIAEEDTPKEAAAKLDRLIGDAGEQARGQWSLRPVKLKLEILSAGTREAEKKNSLTISVSFPTSSTALRASRMDWVNRKFLTG